MREELQRTLQRLHEELEAAGSLDAEQREALRAALREIRTRLDPEPGDADGGLVERLEALALRFESEHPLVADAISNVVRTLSRMGI